MKPVNRSLMRGLTVMAFFSAVSSACLIVTSQPVFGAQPSAGSNAAAHAEPPSKSALTNATEQKSDLLNSGTSAALIGPVESPQSSLSPAVLFNPDRSTSGVAWSALASAVLALLLAAVALAMLLLKLRPLQDRMERLEKFTSDLELKYRGANGTNRMTGQLNRVEDELEALRDDIQKLSRRPAAPSVSPVLQSRSGDALHVEEPAMVGWPITPPPSQPKPLEPEVLMSVVLDAVRRVAASSSSITAANVVGKVRSEIEDPAMLNELSRAAFAIDLYDAGGKKAAQAPELMAVRFEDVGGARCYVVPFPQAGRVARFQNWFTSDGEYQTNPVLAEMPATAESSADGVLQKVHSGKLVKA